ncbi:MAG: PQQ-binding-like beta-propeller repeat protein [Planctomycetes bacterium]|nr:PQQ-binding-like beta-propeller repeat protein [Planctomycetota bacterium]
MTRTLLSIILLLTSWQTSIGKNWPQFRADAARSGYTSQYLPANLSLRWVYKPLHPPQPAWQAKDTRMPFDHALHTIIAEGLVFFGSSADNKVYVLDAVTGKQQWTFFVDSPVRFAPAYWKGRLYVAADDGYLYCLRAKTGTLIWAKRGGPQEDMVLGNSRMISRWPARGAPTIIDDIVYFSAGIWPSEGIYIYALEPETGKVLWVNDSSGSMLIDQPHPTAQANSGVSVQGYLSAADDTLLVPTGRAIPAAFDRKNGAFRYFHLQRYGQIRPGPFITLINGLTFSRNELFNSQTGNLLLRGTPGSAVADFPEYIVFAQGNNIKGIPRSKPLEVKQTKDSAGKLKKQNVLSSPSWSIACQESLGVSLIGAGKTIIAGTKNHKIITADIETKSFIMTADVDGDPKGLAAVDGRLIVSTDKGTIYCFAGKTSKKSIEISPKPKSSVYGKNRLYAKAAAEIIKKTGKTKGYCLDIACGQGRLAYELAKRTDLNIYAVESDPAKVKRARKLLDEAGLYGTRVTVLQRDLSATKLPNYFANLIVSGASVKEGADDLPVKEINRILKPYGGSACLGKPGEMRLTIRDGLKDAGNWTHQYADPANTNCSPDELIKGRLGVLWFTDNDFEMPSRHGRGPAPLYLDGRLFIEGLHGLRSIDAYNGHVIWEYPLENILKAYDQEHLMGTAGIGSNFCVTTEGLYVRKEGKCLQLDPATGKLIAEFPAPQHPQGKQSTWGYIAIKNNILFGTLADTGHIVEYRYGRSDMNTQFTQSVLLFAMDTKTGKLKWSYTPQYSIRNNSIAVGNGNVYFIDAPLDIRDRPVYPNKQQRARKTQNSDSISKTEKTLIALNVNDGEIVWKSSKDIYGTMLALSQKYDILLMAYQDTRFKLVSEVGGRMSAFRASNGNRIWDIEVSYASRPILNDSTIYAQPGAWDLRTGEEKEFHFERSYGCGIIAGSKNLLAFRSATLGYRDLLSGKGTENYGGIRPGCWINTIPAGGLLLVPDATSRCVCSYLIKANIALQPMQ